jgi:hypothetical protein
VIEAVVQIGDDRSEVGKFKFATLPRNGEEITIPWAEYPYGVRIFDIDEVRHIAEGVTNPDFGVGPTIVLLATEIV